jgi:hypothetical protein
MSSTLPIDQMIDTQRGTISREIFVSPEFHKEELEKLFTATGCSSGMRAKFPNLGISSSPAWGRNRSSSAVTRGARYMSS